jgi:outer membrane protein assembly factor BamE (lipoprotein component of BamABCDE complex)
MSIIVFIVSLLLAGCITVPEMIVGNPAVQDEALISQLKVGTSTKNDVAKLFGKPSAVSHDRTDGQMQESWTYSYSVVHGGTISAFTENDTALQSNGSSLTVAFTNAGLVKSVMTHKIDNIPTRPDETMNMHTNTRTK